MNQKYLQGLSTNMDSPEDAVFFEATPENIAAFLSQHQTAQMAAIGTTDNRSFLTTRMGFIDICPDQVFLREKLLPIYANVNHLGESILAWIEKNALGKPTGRTQRSGFVTSPECRFNAERLQELDDNGYFEYSSRYDSMYKPQNPQESVGVEDT